MHARVWIRKRRLKSGKVTYHLRWIDEGAGRWRSRHVGTDSKRAEREAAKLEAELDAGTHCELRSIDWPTFVKEHTERMSGKANRTEAERVLSSFAMVIQIPLRRIQFADVERYLEGRRVGHSLATVAKEGRYLKAAFNAAIRRGYLARSPMIGMKLPKADQKIIRVVSDDEEGKLLTAAKKLYGLQWEAFIQTALATGGRRSELVKLIWSDIDFDAGSLVFRETKGKRDRRVPIDQVVASTLRRVYVPQQQSPGPFTTLRDNLSRQWGRIRKMAKVDASVHDLRRTCTSRLIRAGVPLPTVQRLLGHADISTTVRFYTQVDDSDLRAAVEKLSRRQAV